MTHADLLTATVSDVITANPAAARVLVERGTCVGCVFAPFDTVTDVARVYGVDALALAKALMEARAVPHTLTSMLPKEHGAYGQMAFPLVTSLAVAEVTAPALLLVGSVVALFVAHEPLLVLLGTRGPRARRQQGRRAAVWLGAALAVAVGTAVAAFQSMEAETRWAFGVPVLPAAVLGTAVVAGREKSWYGESMAALAFSLAAVPVALAAGAAPPVALAVAIVFTVTFLAQTLAIRGVILAVRGGGNPRASRTMRRAAMAVMVTGIGGIAAAATRHILPWTTLAAAGPGLAATTWLVFVPPPPSRLRRVGWTLVTASVATAVILLAYLRT